MGKTVAELERGMTSTELSEWLEYNEIEPFGALRDNWHSAQIASMLFNINRGKAKPTTTADFMFIDQQSADEKKDTDFLAFMSSRATKGKVKAGKK